MLTGRSEAWYRRARGGMMSDYRDAAVYVGTVGEGLWRSRDGGESWDRKTTGMYTESEVRALAVHPANAQLLYAGTNQGCFRSTDGADHWTQLDSEMNDLVIWSLLVMPDQPDMVLAGTRPAAVFRSTDGGDTWQRLSAAMAQECPGIVYNRVTTLQVDPAAPDTIWAGVEIDGAWRSDDRGATWTRHAEGLSSLDIHGLALVPQNGAGSALVASTNNDVNTSGDQGQSWQQQQVSKQFPWNYCRGLRQQPGSPRHLFLGNGNGPPGSEGAAWRSADGGASWQRMELPVAPNSTIWDYAFHPSAPELVYAYSVSGQVFRSTDGGDSWHKLAREFGEIRSLLWAPGG